MKYSWIVALLVIGMLIGGLHRAKKKNSIYKHNIEVFNDSIESLKLKNGNLLTERALFKIREKELEEYLDISKSERKELEKELKSSLAYISKIEGQLNVDSVRVDTVVIMDHPDLKQFKFRHNDTWFNFDGVIKLDSIYNINDFKLYNVNIPVPLRVGITDKNKLFITSDNPYLSIKNITGAEILDNTKKDDYKKFHHGIGVGIGIHYGLFHEKFDFGPNVSYNLIYTF